MVLAQHDCVDIDKTFKGPLPESFTVIDHMYGFDCDLKNLILESFVRLAKQYQTEIKT